MTFFVKTVLQRRDEQLLCDISELYKPMSFSIGQTIGCDIINNLTVNMS